MAASRWAPVLLLLRPAATRLFRTLLLQRAPFVFWDSCGRRRTDPRARSVGRVRPVVPVRHVHSLLLALRGCYYSTPLRFGRLSASPYSTLALGARHPFTATSARRRASRVGAQAQCLLAPGRMRAHSSVANLMSPFRGRATGVNLASSAASRGGDRAPAAPRTAARCTAELSASDQRRLAPRERRWTSALFATDR